MLNKMQKQNEPSLSSDFASLSSYNRQLHSQIGQICAEMVGLITYQIKLYSLYPSSEKVCSSVSTGFMIGQNVVLTCAHNFDKQRDSEILAQTITFTKKDAQGKQEIRKAIEVIVSKGYQSTKYSQRVKFKQYDFAILILAQSSITKQQQTRPVFSIAGEEDLACHSQQIFAYGYVNHLLDPRMLYEFLNPPANAPKKIDYLILSKGEILQYDNQTVYHSLRLSKGSSGTPLFYVSGGKFFIVALHNGEHNREGNSTSLSGGITLDCMKQQLEKWRKEFGLKYSYLQL